MWIESVTNSILVWSPSNVNTSSLPLVLSYINTLIHVFCWSVFFRDIHYQFPLGSALIWSSLHCQMPSASLWSKYTIPHLCRNFLMLLFCASQLHFLIPFPILNPNWSPPSTTSIFLSEPLLCILATFDLSHVCDEADGAIFDTVCSIWLLL